MVQLTEFSKRVIQLIQKIPRGKVATYGQLAKLAGKEGAARGVSWILHSCSRKYKLPWHRVIGAQGKISFDRSSSNYLLQKKRLESEGVEFSSLNRIDLKLHQWRAKNVFIHS